jgi:hypothetical protein
MLPNFDLILDLRMTDTSIREALETLRRRYDELKIVRAKLAMQQAEIDQRLSQVLSAIEGLAVVEGGLPEFEAKLADAIRAVLGVSSRALFPTEIRDRLQVINYDFSNQKNPLASVHMVLKGMLDAHELESFIDELEGRPRYRLMKPANLDTVDQWLTGTTQTDGAQISALIRRSMLNRLAHFQDAMTQAPTGNRYGRLADLYPGNVTPTEPIGPPDPNVSTPYGTKPKLKLKNEKNAEG